MRRGLLGVICGLAVWASLWYSLHWALPGFFPKQFSPDGSTDSAVLSLIIVLLSFDFSFFSGYINAIIAKNYPLQYAALQGTIQLALGAYVQFVHWDINPLWFHIAFLSFIFPAVMAGALYRNSSDNQEIP